MLTGQGVQYFRRKRLHVGNGTGEDGIWEGNFGGERKKKEIFVEVVTELRASTLFFTAGGVGKKGR